MTAQPDAGGAPAAPAQPAPDPEPAAQKAPAAAQKSPRALRAQSPQALRTIAAAAQELNLPQHVLRFWETRFPALKPLKRAGGRRYYRPEDMALLRRIRALLHDEGYTVKGAQKILAQRRGGGGGGGGSGNDEGGGDAPAPAQTQTQTPEPDRGADPGAERLRREAALLLQELKDIRTVLTVK